MRDCSVGEYLKSFASCGRPTRNSSALLGKPFERSVGDFGHAGSVSSTDFAQRRWARYRNDKNWKGVSPDGERETILGGTRNATHSGRSTYICVCCFGARGFCP